MIPNRPEAAAGRTATSFAYDTLRRAGQLVLMGLALSLSTGLARAQTPQEVVAQYQNKFDYSFDLPDRWQMQPVNKYQVQMSPATDKAKVGIAFTADILHPVFGTAGFSLERYWKRVVKGLSGQGYPASTAKRFKGLKLDKQWLSMVVDRPDGKGKALFVLTKKKDMIFMYTIVFTEHFSKYFDKYKDDIRTIVDNSQIDVK